MCYFFVKFKVINLSTENDENRFNEKYFFKYKIFLNKNLSINVF